MGNDIFINLFIMFLIAMAVVGMVVVMNTIESQIKLRINKWLDKRASRKRVIRNLNLINKKMESIRGVKIR